jgi:methylmalonyl-CoA mutase
MSDSVLQNLLVNTFSKPDIQSWQKAASSEIEGKDPFSTLDWEGLDKITYHPYYDNESLSSLSYLNNFYQPPAKDSFIGYRSWNAMPHVSTDDEKQANETSLQHLTNGADGIFFHIKKYPLDFSVLLKKIEWNYCSLSFQAAREQEIFSSLQQFITGLGKTESLTGCFFWNTIPDNKLQLIEALGFKSLGLYIAPSTPVHEISEALVTGVKLIEKFSNEHDLKKIIATTAFSLPVNGHFLQQISKLKALRLLWYQVVRAYGIDDYSPEELHMHVRTEQWIKEAYQPHGNMLNGTTASMASIIGGCNSLTVLAEDEKHPVMNRIARNISNILREESHLNKVADPLAGSYVIENMVHEMSQAAWSSFQSRIKVS